MIAARFDLLRCSAAVALFAGALAGSAQAQQIAAAGSTAAGGVETVVVTGTAFDPETAPAKARLETVPWVRNASIERLLPDTLYVRLAERMPLALWQHQGRFDLVDQDGNIIADADIRDYPFLAQVVGSGAPGAAPELLKVLAGEPALQAHVTASVRVGGRRWDIHLDNGIVVSLPENNAANAWHRLAALDRSDKLLERNVQVVDMRLPDRVVLRVPPDVAKSIIKKGKPAQASPNT